MIFIIIVNIQFLPIRWHLHFFFFTHLKVIYLQSYGVFIAYVSPLIVYTRYLFSYFD
jgi:hypothetical protein